MGKKKKKRPELVPVDCPIIDSHAHLSPRTFGDELDAVIERAFKSGLSDIVNIGAGYGEVGIIEVLETSRRHEHLHPTVGIHPHDARLLDEDPSLYDRLREWASADDVVAYGELGLDYHYNHSTPESQRQALREQIRLAKDLDKPIIVHDRDAHDEILAIFDEEKAWDVGVVIHCFSGDWDYAQACIKRGAMISLSGIVTFKSATNLHEVAAKTPVEHLLIETDSPYLAPTPYRGKKNEPQYVHRVLEEIAQYRGADAIELGHQTIQTTRQFFGL